MRALVLLLGLKEVAGILTPCLVRNWEVDEVKLVFDPVTIKLTVCPDAPELGFTEVMPCPLSLGAIKQRTSKVNAKRLIDANKVLFTARIIFSLNSGRLVAL